MTLDFGDDWAKLEQALSIYMDIIGVPMIVVKAEYQLWRAKWANTAVAELPASAVSSLDHAEQFPTISILLQLLATTPISTAEAERFFSKLEKTLTAIRSTMTELRLESLLMLQIHRGDTPTIKDVIDRFAITSARRLNFNM